MQQIVSTTADLLRKIVETDQDLSTEEGDVDVIRLSEKFDRFQDYWNPRIVGEVNDMHVKLVKLKGDFVWHHHEEEDELFLVVQGHLLIKLRDRELRLGPGDLTIIPRGVDHIPIAEEEVHVLLVEPRATVNTGSAGGERTVAEPERL
jgi:mannose-6-phosphate isomerase-like protein (cupin superfamily)